MGSIFKPKIPAPPPQRPAPKIEKVNEDLNKQEAKAEKDAEAERKKQEQKTKEEGVAAAKGLRGYRSLLTGTFAGYRVGGSGRGFTR